MKTKNVRQIIRRAAAIITAISILVFQLTTDVVFANMTVEANENTAIICGEITSYGNRFDINGQLKKTENLPEMHRGIISLLSEETRTEKTGYTANETSYDNENSIYSGENININCQSADIKKVLVAEKDITINAGGIKGEEYTVIYSKGGNITINISEMNYKGLLYAPEGEITINGTNINIDGSIVAKKVNLYVNTFTINADRYSESMFNVLKTYRNDRLLTLTGYTYEDDINIAFEAEDDVENVDIYIRNDDERAFTYLATTGEKAYTISEYSFEKYMDIMAVAKTTYGDTYESTLMTVGYSNEEGAEKLCALVNDNDEDGIPDGTEVWYSKTDPMNSDSDGDGIDDYTECFYLCTDPNVKNEDSDSDGDGIKDREEIYAGTHPYLKDTDFDGYGDNEDSQPLKYNEASGKKADYTEDRVIGIFDKVNTWIDGNGNIYQYIYNFITDNVEYTMINGVITKYYYNINEQLMAVVTINEDVLDAVTYTYDGEVLSSVAYKGFVYEFTTEDGKESITIGGQSYKKTAYEEMEQTTAYGNGFEIKNIFNEYGDTTAVYYNKAVAFECEYNEKGQIVSISDHLTGYGQKYTYEEDGEVAVVSSNNYSIEYQYSDEEYIIKYDVNGEKYSQTIYNDTEDKYASKYSSSLISGALHENISTEEGDIEYKITDTEVGKVVFSNLFTYEGTNVTKLVYNNGDSLAYEYTKEGKISRILQNGNEMVKYHYDNLGRIVREDNACAGRSYEYIYNDDNNLKTKREYSYSTEELSVPLSEEEYYYENIWKDQITEISGESITYDEIGNPVYYRDKMIFEWEGKMLSKADSTTGDASYTYNNEGVRTSKTINGVKTEYIIEGRDIVFETGADGTTAYIYDSDMNVIGMMRDNAAYYYEKNAQGDVIRILDENADILCEYTYDAWGRTVSVTGDSELAEKNPFRYRSYYFDNETGLYYVESRYYDPETGRFINADNIEGIVWDYTNLNMYAYCGNDPVNYYDPTGEAPIYVKTFISRDIYEYDADVAAAEKGDNVGMENAITQAARLVVISNTWWVSDMKKGGSNVRYILDNKKDFIDSWNSILNATVIVLMAHGSPTSLNINGERIYSSEINSKLDRKQVKFLWLISCNAGHYDYRYTNIAAELSKKVSGYVIASDGTVACDYANVGGRRVFAGESFANGLFVSYSNSNRMHAYGWILYNYSMIGKSVVCNVNGLGTGAESIYSISNFLVNKKYISYK